MKTPAPNIKLDERIQNFLERKNITYPEMGLVEDMPTVEKEVKSERVSTLWFRGKKLLNFHAK